MNCEIFIKDIPRENFEHDLLPHFERFGRIYSFRLMMDYDNRNRGYAYLRYSTESEAQCAIDVMKYYLIGNGLTLEIQKSYNKCRLYARNIPCQKRYEEVYETMKELFPKMTKLMFHTNIAKNRGFAFIDFPDHESALEAKMKSSPGYIRLWGQEIKIVWANPERYNEFERNIENSTTLFVRNIGLDVTKQTIRNFVLRVVPPCTIQQITSVRDFAFIEFNSHEAAATVKRELHGQCVKLTPVDIEWARPSTDNSVHKLKNTDFDAELRFFCIANYWDVPIILYGRVYEKYRVQCASVIIKREKFVHIFFIEICYINLTDIQSRISEIIVNLINTFGHLPTQHLVIRADQNTFTVVGFMKLVEAPYFMPSGNAVSELTLFFDEIYDLALFSQMIATMSSQTLYQEYEAALSNQKPHSFLDQLTYMGRVVGCFNGKLREKPPLKHNLDNRQILLVLCCAYTRNNFIFHNKPSSSYPLKVFYPNGVVINDKYLQTISLLPTHFVQNKKYGPHMEYVLFGQQAAMVLPGAMSIQNFPSSPNSILSYAINEIQKTFSL